jgi:endonuclease III
LTSSPNARQAQSTSWPSRRASRRSVGPGNRSGWELEAVDHIKENASYFPRGANRSSRGLEEVVRLEGQRIAEIAALLAAAYGTPDLGNKSDPVDELVYIALSRRTREGAYQASYNALKKRWPRWDAVADASIAEVTQVIRSGGLGERKARSIVGALRELRETFGGCRLEVDTWPDDEVAAFLSSLPELGPKSAACIMAMSLNRQAFAVDAHVGRVMARVAPYAPLGLELASLEHKRRQALLPSLIPPELRRDLHVNLVVHGREVCRATRPNCSECPIRSLCRRPGNDIGQPAARRFRRSTVGSV